MNKYYFLTCSLPKIQIGLKPDVFFEELCSLLDLGLSTEDKKTLFEFRLYIDLKNLKNFWMNKKIDSRGNFDEKGLAQAVLVEEYFPFFVFDFIKQYSNVKDRIDNFFYLEMVFLKHQITRNFSDFLNFFFQKERDVKLILAALRALKQNRDIVAELKFEDKTDPLVKSILNEGDRYEPPLEYLGLKEMYQKNKLSPKDLYLSFLNYNFAIHLDVGRKYFFTINEILAYAANLLLVEDYYYLNSDKGRLIIDKLL